MYLQLRVVGGTEVQVGACSSSDQVQFDCCSVVAGVERVNEAPQHRDVVRVDSVLALKRRNKLEVDVRRSNDVNL